ncbi:MAG: mechanosensitive ion channel [Rickettsiales bacterium]|nr:mechanosensitive ion channel [Rickettsiales bacterium]
MIDRMQEWLNTLQFSQNLEQVIRWVTDELLVTGTLVQLAVLGTTLMVAFIAARRVAPVFSKVYQSIGVLNSFATKATKRGIILPLTWLTLQLLSLLVVSQLDQPSRLLVVFANLTAAWVAIRFFSGFVRNPAFSKLIAMIAWSVAALNILGWLDSTVKFLDEIAFDAGDLHISLLTVAKGLITLGFLLWGAISFSGLSERYIRNVSGLTPSLQVLLSKLIKIALVTFAILVGVSSVGIDITALAVFSGAVGVGIGFGLQKIVSNFISGIILLVDRSIKPGDVIEVEDTYGWINKLSGRHVSVITRDGKEHLIPNEDLITQRVINWSYSSKSVRLKVPVGISYNADPHEAKRLILESIKDIGRVLENPAPACLITGFGDNSVDLELRAWIEDPSNGVSNVKSEILFAIWDSFAENGIEIPFPQRDVHVKMDDEMVKALKKKA